MFRHHSDESTPVLDVVRASFDSMRSTTYQHHTAVDERAGVYDFDCVGLVHWALKQSAPAAMREADDRLHIAPGRIPSPIHYQELFGSLEHEPLAHWQPVPFMRGLQPGDVVAWGPRTDKTPDERHSNGHAVVIASAPRQIGETTYAIDVYDSTASPHGPDDTRRSSPKNQPMERSGKPSGLGRGTMAIETDATGRPVGVRWSESGRVSPVPIAAARPLV